METIIRGLLITDFTADNIANMFKKSGVLPRVELTVVPFAEAHALLFDPQHTLKKKSYDFIIIWTQPGNMVPSFKKKLDGEGILNETIDSETRQFAQAVCSLSAIAGTVLIPSWTLPLHDRGMGILNMHHNSGYASLLMKMNLILSETFQDKSSIMLLDAYRWIGLVGTKAYNPKLWYMAKIPFSNDVFQIAVEEMKSALNTAKGLSKKIIMLDLDNTLWGGIVGDDGWENLSLGGHSFKGEAFQDFQQALLRLKKRGVLLSLVSKNEEAIALEAIDKHPEMILRRDDFVGWRINWDDKAKNIEDLTRELNLGLQSVVFLDDNPYERERVREALPEVYVPELPKDPMSYVSFLQSMSCFDTIHISEEDVARTEQYLAENARRESRRVTTSLEDWLSSIDIRVTIEECVEANIKRAVQLLNKTNQMNVTTRRMSEAEFISWKNESNRWVRVFRVEDKYGELGLVGIVSFEFNEDSATIVDYILSCRAMGRQVEQCMLATACKEALQFGAKIIKVYYKKTAKNKPCLNFFKSSGMAFNEEAVEFSWDLSNHYAMPKHMTIR